ncbi:SpoIIE family protein phosphatase [Streptomyces seoulensis]
MRLVLLVSDGVSDQIEEELFARLCREHGQNPQSLADAVVAAAETDETGYRDDATVVVPHRT